MSAPQFTPGPWYAAQDACGHDWWCVTERAFGYRVASVSVPSEHHRNSVGATVECTARLIAAAPELFEALSATLPYLEEGYLEDEDDDEPVGWTADNNGENQRPMALTFGMVRKARAALAKARGEVA